MQGIGDNHVQFRTVIKYGSPMNSTDSLCCSSSNSGDGTLALFKVNKIRFINTYRHVCAIIEENVKTVIEISVSRVIDSII